MSSYDLLARHARYLYCRAQANTLTLSLEIIRKSDFSDATYNSTYFSDVQSLNAKTQHRNAS